ncbi:FG-GAP-like repeat-containing protein [Streptomyces lushanensis]|uniref:FG-GAP-like repeat-containing protein n=1 Tax=Streptomyces lushanensis TaxID=1434255 RepID=UPI0009A0349D|nr:FG-GAP-like repeat-containing protein [Streptomyces lushanensis]
MRSKRATTGTARTTATATGSTRRRTSRMSATAAATVLLTIGATITATASPPAAAPNALAAAHDDFNRDGYPDLVVSAPGGTVSAQKGAGYVAVLYGSASGLSTSRRATFSLSTPGIPGLAQTGDGFGRTTASGDLDGDGYADLVIGMPGRDIGTTADAGAAVVLWGSANGLRTTGPLWLQDDTPTAGTRFGMGLATGRFKGTDVELALLSRRALSTYGFEATADGGHTAQGTPMDWKWREEFTPTGLTSGDYGNSGADDVVLLGTVTVDEGIHPVYTFGGASYLPGGPDGLTYGRGLSGGPVGASGDINNDGWTDLVFGSPTDTDDLNESLLDGGTIDVFLGGFSGPSGPAATQHWTQTTIGASGDDKTGDRFGSSVTVGDVNGDGYADAAFGAPANDINSLTDPGTVWVMRGTAQGLAPRNLLSFSQSTPSVPGDNENHDWFGGAVRLIDADQDGKAELVASAPGKNTDDGAAWVFPGTGNGPTGKGSWSFDGATLSAPSPDARFGETLAP